MAETEALSQARFDAATQAVCNQRTATLGVASCKARGRRCPWPESCGIIADAVIRVVLDFEEEPPTLAGRKGAGDAKEELEEDGARPASHAGADP